MKSFSPIVLLDDASPGGGAFLRFERPWRIIAAFEPGEVRPALAELEAALAEGHYLAGWFAYELGYALSARLMSLEWPGRKLPLLWFGVFSAPDRVARTDLNAKGRAYAGPLRHEWDEPAYTERFRRAREYIEAGDIYQANLSFRSRFRFAGDPFDLYLSLRDRAQARHCAYVDMGERQILSLSPELFFEASPEGAITTRPMKGTTARREDPVSDMAAKIALAASEKERAENLMIVDLMRNDLGRVAVLGSVAVPQLFAVETYPTLHTMVSTVTARLRPSTPVSAIVEALFPCGSVTGAPKIRAMEIIRELEASPRGIYCGSIGYFAPTGAACFNVAIRTITIAEGKGELGIGGAVVHDSGSKSEYEECLLKARYFDVARRPLHLVETLRYAPGAGFVRLERHLARMEASAAGFGFPFVRDGAIAALEGEVVNAGADLRVRLALDEAGEFDVSSAPLAPASAEWRFALSPVRIPRDDVLLRHKTDWRDLYEDEYRRATARGLDEIVFLNDRGEVTEGSRTNIFARIGGELVTPPLSSGLLNGCLRQEMLEQCACVERVLHEADLNRAEAIYLGNSLRGLIPASRARERKSTGGGIVVSGEEKQCPTNSRIRSTASPKIANAAST